MVKTNIGHFIFQFFDMLAIVGYSEFDNPNFTIENYIHDAKWVEYMADYLDALLKSLRYEYLTSSYIVSMSILYQTDIADNGLFTR